MAIRTHAVNLIKNLIIGSGLVNYAIKKEPFRLRILMYHGICPQNLTPDMFEWQLIYIKKHFDTYWMSEVPGLICDGPRGDKPSIILTFDDGLKNNKTYAAPLLEKYGVKATFYIVSGLLGGSQMLWNHDVFCRLFLMDESELKKLTGIHNLDRENKLKAIRKFVSALKKHDNTSRLEFIRKVETASGDIELSPEMQEQYEVMSGDDVRQLPDNIEIGGHTVSHPMLDCVSIDEAKQEIIQCKEDLEQLTKKNVRSFCYPNGNLSDEIIDCVAGNYDCAASVREGFTECGSNLFDLKRIPAGRNKLDFVYRMISPTS